MSDANRWAKLAVSVLAQTGTSFYQFGVPYLLPEIQSAHDASLFEGALLVAAPSVGMVATLYAWGHLADRVGDRPVMVAGLTGAGTVLLAVPVADSLAALGVLLFLAGAWGASVNVTSGRIVLQAFDARRRGAAMGVRQTSPLLGMGLAALTLHALSVSVGYEHALAAPALVCLGAAALAAITIGPSAPRTEATRLRGPSPYRADTLWRLHGASALLVVPQIAVASFAFLYLVSDPRWTPRTAGIALAIAMAIGAALRLLAGMWSDRVGHRLAPMRTLALGGFGVLSLSSALMALDVPAGSVVLLAAAAVTAAWNGLAFTAVAETAGPAWAGRALGVQNTLQYVTTAGTPPLMAIAIGSGRFAFAFLAASFAGLVAALLVPVQRVTAGAVIVEEGAGRA